MVELVKIFSVVCICADDWQSNSKSVGKYSGASSHKGGWRNDNYASDELSHADRAWQARQSMRLSSLTKGNWSATTGRCVRVGGNTNMILFAIIGENLGVIEDATVTSATIVGMLIVCWAIYTVYTGESCNL